MRRRHSSAVRRSCQTMARWTAVPVPRSHRTVVSRWLVMPMAAISVAPLPQPPSPADRRPPRRARCPRGRARPSRPWGNAAATPSGRCRRCGRPGRTRWHGCCRALVDGEHVLPAHDASLVLANHMVGCEAGRRKPGTQAGHCGQSMNPWHSRQVATFFIAQPIISVKRRHPSSDSERYCRADSRIARAVSAVSEEAGVFSATKRAFRSTVTRRV